MSALTSGLLITTFGRTLRFEWDRDAQQLKLLNPSPQNIRLYNQMQDFASRLAF